MNRVDRILTYQPLDETALAEILDQHIAEFHRHVEARRGPGSVDIDIPPEPRRALLRRGTSLEYGARELKRTLHRHLTEPLAALVAGGSLAPGASLRLVVGDSGGELALEAGPGGEGCDDGY